MVPTGVSIFVATMPVDLRGGFDRLSGIVTEALRGDPRGTSLYVFVNKRRTRVKVLFYDRTGHCLLYKRLDRGTDGDCAGQRQRRHLGGGAGVAAAGHRSAEREGCDDARGAAKSTQDSLIH
jgi:hypothetical protein